MVARRRLREASPIFDRQGAVVDDLEAHARQRIGSKAGADQGGCPRGVSTVERDGDDDRRLHAVSVRTRALRRDATDPCVLELGVTIPQRAAV